MQNRFNDFKASLGWEPDGLVGRGWWNGFIRLNRDKITTKQGAKYGLDRSL